MWAVAAEDGLYLVMRVRDAQESMETLMWGQIGPLWSHSKMPLASHPCKIACSGQQLSQSHLIQGQAPLGAGPQNSRVHA